MTQKETYDAYLLSQHWSDLRESALNRANRRCEACGAKAINGHHVKYRTPLEDCTVEDIMALCSRCHDMWHDWLKQIGKHVHDFCRQSTRGGILALLNPLHAAQHPPKSSPPVYRPISKPVPRLSKKQEKRMRNMEKERRKAERKKEHEARVNGWKNAGVFSPVVPLIPKPPKSPTPKAVKRQARVEKYERLLSDPVFKDAIDNFSRDGFKSFMRKWGVSRYAEFGGWNSLLSTAIAMYDRQKKKNIHPVYATAQIAARVDDQF